MNEYFQIFLIDLLKLNKIDAIDSNKTPKIIKLIEINVNGIEKYLVSLKTVITFIEEKIPAIKIINPGTPKNVRGRLISIISIKESNTPPP